MLYQEFLKQKLYSILEKFFLKKNQFQFKKIDFSIDISPKREFGDLSQT